MPNHIYNSGSKEIVHQWESKGWMHPWNSIEVHRIPYRILLPFPFNLLCISKIGGLIEWFYIICDNLIYIAHCTIIVWLSSRCCKWPYFALFETSGYTVCNHMLPIIQWVLEFAVEWPMKNNCSTPCYLPYWYTNYIDY